MGYQKEIKDDVYALKEYLLGKISYSQWKKSEKKIKETYKIQIQSNDFKEFSEKMFDFFKDRELVKIRLSHEKKHFIINKKYKIKSKFILKKYRRAGKMRYRPSVIGLNTGIIKKWEKKKVWKYYFDQTSMKDASDNDKRINNMLKSIKKKIF